MLHIYNSLTGQKEKFTPIDPENIRIYVCGMTVYDYCHLGHARAMVVFDMVVRYLRSRGNKVTYVRNITDIDDKIIARALENDETTTELTERFTKAMHEDAAALGVLQPDFEPKATESVNLIIQMIGELIGKGMAYQGESGDVYCNVTAFDGYGKLSGKKLEDLQAGKRIAVEDDKKSPFDFVLWKMSKEGEPSWESPWGAGRPGWHIECSAMARDKLGDQFDIHGGGLDLQFPHHENEIAISETVTGKPFVKYWIHNGHIRVNQEKMSKSLGNFFTIREIFEEFKAEEVRFFLLSSGYRSPLNYSVDNLHQAKKSLSGLYLALRGTENHDENILNCNNETVQAYKKKFFDAMDDDFNTPGAISVLHEMATEINRRKSQNGEGVCELSSALIKLGNIIGFFEGKIEEYFVSEEQSQSSDKIEKLIEQRNQARKDKDWGLADSIRDQLQKMGVVIEDSAAGTTWRYQ
ncbi:MAG: cysteine--tRNA ligase [Gammaproteobacteria bacterium]|nr:MAG: cysteine--tRNA ligase [Gammaproteobacteria bacterium]